jgi:hypothetical protein
MRFTRIMNASTSPYGVLTDPPIVAIATAPLVIALFAAIELQAEPSVVNALGVLAAMPTLIAVGASVALFRARNRVVAFLASLPFPLENMNAILNGLGEVLEITFADACPTSPELNAALDKVSQDTFVTRAPDIAEAKGRGDGEAMDAAKAPPDRVIEIRIGVVESKQNPAGSNYRRFERVRALAGSVLVSLHPRFAIVEVRVK